MPQALDDETTKAVYAAMREGYSLKTNNDIEGAVQCFRKAWDLLPEPKFGWDISQITMRRFAKFFHDIQKLEEAENWARKIFECNVAEGDGVPFVILGSILFDAGKVQEAKECFAKGFQSSGRRAFGDEYKYYLQFAPTKRK